MDDLFENLADLNTLVKSTEMVLVKNSRFIFINGLDNPYTKNTLAQLNDLPNESTIETFREELDKIILQYNLNYGESLSIQLHLFNMGEIYIREIWAKAGFSFSRDNFSKDIERAINIARYFEYTSLSTSNPAARAALGYLSYLKDKLMEDGDSYKKNYKKDCKRSGGDQEQTTTELLQLSIAKIILILDQKKPTGTLLKILFLDLQLLHGMLYSKIHTYSDATLANYYRKFKNDLEIVD
ncbi:MAG: hypothetical protein HOP07_10330 [Bacteriovoracaceae bacterium]|nr:hypothetical protein [Bacteriovoracaceae bacterium]